MTPEGVEDNLTVYPIGSRGDCSQLSFPNTHSLSYTHTHTHTHTHILSLSLSLSISLSNQLAVCTEIHRTSQTVLLVKNPPTCQCRRCQRCEFNPWLGKIPWRRKWQPIPVLWPGEFHGQRSLVGYRPWGQKELDTTEST